MEESKCKLLLTGIISDWQKYTAVVVDDTGTRYNLASILTTVKVDVSVCGKFCVLTH